MLKKVLFASILLLSSVLLGLVLFGMADKALADASAELEQAKSNVISLIQKGNYAEAQVQTQKLLADFSEHKDLPSAVGSIAYAYYRHAQKYEKARELYQYILENWPDDDCAIHAQNGIAFSNIVLENDAAAQAAVKKLFADFSGHKDLLSAVRSVAYAYYRHAQKYEKARELYQYILENWPDDEGAIYAQEGLAKSYIELGNDSQAEAATERLLADFSEDKRLAKAVRPVADTYRCTQRHEKAIELYQYILENRPDDEGAIHTQRGIALSNIALKNDATAQAAVKKLFADFSGHKDLPWAVHSIADEYRYSQEYEKAGELYQYILNNWPEADHARWSEMGLAMTNVLSLIKSGEDDAAQAALDKLIADFNDHLGLPRAMFITGEEYCKQAFRKKSEGLDTKARDDFTKALTVMERIIQELPESAFTPSAYYSLAACYCELGEYEKPIEYCKKIVDTWPDYRNAWRAQFMIGRCYEELERQGRIPASEASPKIKQAYQKLLESYPNCTVAPIVQKRLNYTDYN